jgi:hypothetical protein
MQNRNQRKVHPQGGQGSTYRSLTPSNTPRAFLTAYTLSVWRSFALMTWLKAPFPIVSRAMNLLSKRSTSGITSGPGADCLWLMRLTGLNMGKDCREAIGADLTCCREGAFRADGATVGGSGANSDTSCEPFLEAGVGVVDRSRLGL